MNEKPTFSLQWHITTECDQRCDHCYIFNSPDAKDEIRGSRKVGLKVLKAIADNFKASCERLDVLPRIAMTGGDPILSPYFWDLLEYLQTINIRVSLMGNPFHITAGITGRLYSAGIRDYQMSLDGLEDTHDSIRKKGSFQATFKAAEVLKSGGIYVSIMTTVSKLNAADIPQLTRLMVKAGISSCAFARYCPSSSDDLKYMFTPLEYRAFLEEMWRVYDELSDQGTRFSLKDHLWNLLLAEKGLFKPEDTKGIVVAGCGMAVSHMTVLADGQVYACRRFKSPIGRVPEQNLDELFLGGIMHEFRVSTNYEKCGACELYTYCRGCSAVSYSTSGGWKSEDPQCWK